MWLPDLGVIAGGVLEAHIQMLAQESGGMQEATSMSWGPLREVYLSSTCSTPAWKPSALTASTASSHSSVCCCLQVDRPVTLGLS